MAKDKELPSLDDSSESKIIPAASLPGDTAGTKGRGKYFQMVGGDLVGIPVAVVNRYKKTVYDDDGNEQKVDSVDIRRLNQNDAFAIGVPVREVAAEGCFLFE